MANKPNNPSLWSKSKSLAKSKFAVYPSAYANGWAAKHYKSKGGTWRKAQMGMEVPQEENAMPMAGQIEMPKLDSFIPMMSKGGVNNPGFKSLPSYVQAKIKANMGSGGMAAPISRPRTYGMNMMQTGGFAPQTNAGMSVLQEAMQNSRMGNPMAPVVGPDAMPMMKRGGMSYYQSGGKMPTDIARARFMAAADGNAQAAKSKASQYGYKLQEGGGPLRFSNAPSQTPGQPGFNFQQASAAKTAPAKKAVAPKNNLMDKYKKQATANAAEAEAGKKQNRNLAQKIGDDFPTYLNLSSKRNVVTDLADMATLGASKLGMSQTAATIQQGKQAFTSVGKSGRGKAIDFVNPLSIAANIVGGAVGTLGDLGANKYSGAGSRFAKTAALTATRGAASNVAGAVVGKATNKFLGHGVQHQLQHAGQHALLSPMLAHKEGGTVKEMYMMKKGGFPDRYKKMGFSGVNKPKRTSSGGKSHAVVTKVGGNYKLIRFGQQGVSGSPDGSARNKAFKARHAKNIAKGKSSAAYWANKTKW